MLLDFYLWTANIPPSPRSINYPNPKIRNGKYPAGRLQSISDSSHRMHIKWGLALSMKPTCYSCPHPCSRILSCDCTLESPGACYNTDCWAPPTPAYLIQLVWGQGLRICISIKFSGDTAAAGHQALRTTIWGPEWALEFYKATQMIPMWPWLKSTVHIILILSCSNKTTGYYLLNNEPQKQNCTEKNLSTVACSILFY